MNLDAATPPYSSTMTRSGWQGGLAAGVVTLADRVLVILALTDAGLRR
jgi:hypothetical protein